MDLTRLFAAAIIPLVLLATQADAQTQRRAPQAPAPAATPVAPAAVPLVPTATPPFQPAQVERKCLRALNGACTNVVAVEAVRQRAQIIPAVQVSYLGTPAGTIGGDDIPYQRFFQDNPMLFGLPTFTLNTLCCIVRSK